MYALECAQPVSAEVVVQECDFKYIEEPFSFGLGNYMDTDCGTGCEPHSSEAEARICWGNSREFVSIKEFVIGVRMEVLIHSIYCRSSLSLESLKKALEDKDNAGYALMAGLDSSEEWGRIAKCLQLGLNQGWVRYDPEKEEYEMQRDTDDLTTLMWQVALTNWDTTKKELSTAQVATMARISLQALGSATFPGSSKDYDPEQVTKSMGKAQTVITELNERMRVEKGRLLAESKS